MPMPFRSILLLSAVPLLAMAIWPSANLRAQNAKPDSQAESTPLSYTCPMHPEVVQGEKGTCPICKMNLIPVRLESIWSCPVHSVVAETKGGKCPVCGRDLIQVTVA